MAQTRQMAVKDKPQRQPNVQTEKKDQVTMNADDEKMALTSRVLLSAELMGTEAALAFEQIYTMPNLQTLGMPLSLLSLTSLAAGPTAVVLVTLLGWFSDRGSNPTRRRAWALILSAMVLVSGLAVVTVANLLHLRYVVPSFDSNQLLNTIRTSQTPGAEELSQTIVGSAKSYATGTTSPASYVNYSNVSFQPVGISHSSELTSVSTNRSQPSTENDVTGSVPVTAGIGMLGYVLIDVGYDCITSNVRTWMLTCSPRSQPTLTFAAGLVMTSLGGMLSSVLGTVELPSVVGLSSRSQSGVSLQTSIHAAFVAVLVLLGMASSLVVGNKQLRRKRFQKLRNSALSCKDEIHPNVCAKEDTEDDQSDIFLDRNAREKASPPEEFPILSSHPVYGQKDAAPDSHTPLLAKRISDDLSPKSVSGYNIIHDTNPVSRAQRSAESSHSLGVSEDSSDRQRLLPGKTEKARAACCSFCPNRWSYKATIALLCCSVFFSVGVINVYMLTISDFVGKEIYGGDPEAPSGSYSLARYQEGIRMASNGSLVYYAVYLVFSFVQQRILRFTGYKLEFVAVQLVLSVCLMLLALTYRLEAFFLLCGVAGLQRAVFHVVPFAIISDVIHAEAERSGDAGSPRLGMAMAMVTATAPLANTTLFPWVGPLESVTGVVAVPLWLGAGFAVISAALFLLLGL